MNRTYFGDTRDLFKFDLVRHIMKAMPVFDSFTFIPMLTDTPLQAGRKKSAVRDLKKATKLGRAGSQNRDLVTHMERLQEIDNDLEYFQTIHDYFKKENILVDILHKEQFSHQGRSRYFDTILSRLPKKTLIFLDPDIGLEESRPTEKHLLFEEVERIAKGMDDHSILVIYQHFPRLKRDGYVRHRCNQLAEIAGADPLTITDNEIVFFLIARNEKLKSRLEAVLELYADTYPVLDSSGSC